MAKPKPNMAAALAATKTPEAPPAVEPDRAPITGQPKPRQKGRENMANVATWFPMPVKHALDELRLKRSREAGRRVTLQDLMAEAVNDLFKKHGMPEYAPSKDD